jgi:hypothetical protein
VREPAKSELNERGKVQVRIVKSPFKYDSLRTWICNRLCGVFPGEEQVVAVTKQA